MKTIQKLGIVVLLITGLSCSTEKKYDGYWVKGTVIGLDAGVITDRNGEEVATLSDGKFEIKGKAESVSNAYFRINDEYGFSMILGNESFDISLDINNADDRGQISEVEIEGSAINAEVKKIQDYLGSTPEDKHFMALYEKSKTLEQESEEYKKNYKAISDAREARRKVQSAYIKDYALNNPSSYAAAFYMRFQANEVDQTFEEFEQIVEGFSKEVKKSEFYKPLKDELDGLKRTAIGVIAPDFTLKTDKDEDFTLSSIWEEKIVLVDFWASWCVPCRKSYPHLKEVYNKYRDSGFEVVAVTNDTNHEQWKKAIADDGLEWIQVADVFPPRGSNPATAKVITEYAAPYLPSTYLLDKNGVILAKHLHGEELDHKLEELFGF